MSTPCTMCESMKTDVAYCAECAEKLGEKWADVKAENARLREALKNVWVILPLTGPYDSQDRGDWPEQIAKARDIAGRALDGDA